MSKADYAWQRLKKNTLALLGLGIICLFLFVSVFGYLIAPDGSPDANNQKLELAMKPPGFKVKEIHIRKNEPLHNPGFFSKLIYGQENDYKEVPFRQFQFKENALIYEEYTGKENIPGCKIKYNLADIVYAIDYSKPFTDNVQEGYIQFYDIDSGQQLKRNRADLQNEIVNKQIKEHHYFLGTDRAGRDMLSRLIIGTRISFTIGFISVILSIFIGVLLGALSGYYRGWADNLIMWIINVVWSIPTLLLVIALTFVLGKGFWQVFIAVGFTMWVEVARVIRGQIISLREKEYVEAGRALGFSSLRIIARHLLPNITGTIIVLSAANFANAILIEAGLSFLGIGAQPPTVSWGSMINDHKGYIIANAAYLAFLPGLAIMLMVLAFVLLGNGLRDVFDTKTMDEVSI